MVKTVKSGMQDCGHLKEDWTKMVEMAAIFENPTEFVYHVGKDLIVNGHQIYQEINTATVDYKNKNWYDFGLNVGKATAKTIIGSELAVVSNKDKLGMIVQGLMEEFGAHFDLYALLVCIYDEDQAALAIDMGVQMAEEAYKNHDIPEGLASLLVLFTGYKQVLQGLPACEAVITSSFNWKPIEQCYEVLDNPMEHFKIIENDLKVNGASILADLEGAIKAYKAGDYN